MGVKSKKEKVSKREIDDDVTTESKAYVVAKEQDVEPDKLDALKKKLAAKQDKEDDMPPRIVEEKTRSIRMGVIGSGQAGSRLAEAFHKLGYESVAVNTASQDLEHIEMPDSNKLLLDHGLGGAAKELDIGAAAAESHKDAINELVNKKLGDAQVILFCTSLGGGSGAGSAETVVDILVGMDCPIAVITILPQSTDDAQIKHNALLTLSKFTKMAQARKIDNLIVADNAKIETIYSDVGPLNFFPVSNKAIVDPIDKFNSLSSMPSAVKGLDPTEFGKLFTDGQGLTIYGTMKVPNYEDETAIAEAVIEDLNSSLLAGGFNLKQARYVGAIFTASEEVWNKIPSASVNYAMSMINDVCGNPLGVFRGIYSVDTDEDAVTVYSMFAGLGLPEDRVQQLKEDSKGRMAQAEKKDEERNMALKVDAGEETVSAAEAIKKRIAAKKSKFGKLHGKAVIDRRKR
jgi:cell division GTPase FtsZ